MIKFISLISIVSAAFTVSVDVATAHASSQDKTTWSIPRSSAQVYTAPRWDRRDGGRHLQLHTENGADNVVLVKKQYVDGLGQRWMKIQLAGRWRPLTRWVKRAAISDLQVTHTRVLISRAKRHLYVSRNGKTIYDAPVGIGKASTPTPKGSFWIREVFRKGAPYGSVAFGTSARPPGGVQMGFGNIVGIHGTAGLGGPIPGAISHGCVRVKNITRLGKYLDRGVPVQIR